MVLPNTTITVQEGSAVPLSNASNRILIIGPSSNDSKADEVFTFGNVNNVSKTIGYGAAQVATEIVMSMAPSGYALADVVVAKASNTGAASITQSKVNDAPDIDITGSAFMDYDLGVEITKAGTFGEARFRYTLDGGYSWAYENKVPLSGEFVIPRTGLTVTFEDNQTLGNRNYSSVKSAKMTAQDVTEALEFVVSNSDRSYTYILIADENTEADASIFDAVNAYMDTLNNVYRLHTTSIVPVGGESKILTDIPVTRSAVPHSAVLNVFANKAQNTGNFIAAVAEKSRVTLPIAYPGFTAPSLPFAFACAGEFHGVGRDISKNPAESIVRRVVKTSYDEFLDGEVYNEEKIIAPRTFRGEAGFFINQGNLKCEASSTFDLIPKGRITSRAREVLYTALRKYLNTRVAVVEGGSINPVDKANIESDVNSLLASALMSGINGAGGKGHVSGLSFTLDGENNILQTSELIGVCEIMSFAYPTSINVSLSLSNDLSVSDINVE